jgi:hypothetical protein
VSLLLAFDDEVAQGLALAAATGWPLALVDRHVFPDGETRLRLPADLPPHTVLLRGLQQPNARLTELLLAAAGARDLGAQRLTLVCRTWPTCGRTWPSRPERWLASATWDNCLPVASMPSSRLTRTCTGCRPWMPWCPGGAALR